MPPQAVEDAEGVVSEWRGSVVGQNGEGYVVLDLKNIGNGLPTKIWIPNNKKAFSVPNQKISYIELSVWKDKVHNDKKK